MSTLESPDQEMLKRWLEQARVEYYLCDHCAGLHVRALQHLEGVVDSRVFLEHHGVMFATELEIRPMAILPLAADLTRLNMEYPTLKVFLDVVDDATPHLVVSANLLTTAGASIEQFTQFVVNTMEGARQLAQDCLQLDYLLVEPQGDNSSGQHSLH
jgi:hypothetical protein